MKILPLTLAFLFSTSPILASCPHLPIAEATDFQCEGINHEWNVPSMCQCPSGYEYDNRNGLCFEVETSFPKIEFRGVLEKIDNNFYLRTDSQIIYLQANTKTLLLMENYPRNETIAITGLAWRYLVDDSMMLAITVESVANIFDK